MTARPALARVESTTQPVIGLCHILDSLGPGGTQRFLTHLVPGLKARGYRQWVVSLNDSVDPAIRAQLGASARVLVLNRGALLTGIGLVRLILVLRREKIDVAQTYLRFGDTLGRLAAKLAGVPLIVSSIRARNIDKPRWQFWIDRYTARWTRSVIFNSESVVEFSTKHEGIDPEKAVYIPNGVAPPPPPAVNRETLLASAGVDPSKRVIVSVGRLAPQKGHDDLLRAFAVLAATRPEVHLVIIGEGPARNHLERVARDLDLQKRVTLIGFRRDVRDWLAAAEMFALASRFEGMPNAMMEAMAAGLPVVATQVDGTKELVTDRLTGLAVPAGSPERFAAALEELLTNTVFAQSLGNAARQMMRERYSIERMVDSYDNIYRRGLDSVRRMPCGSS